MRNLCLEHMLKTQSYINNRHSEPRFYLGEESSFVKLNGWILRFTQNDGSYNFYHYSA